MPNTLNETLVEPPAQDPVAQERLQSLDAYRGLIMVALAFGGFGLARTAQNHINAGEQVELWESIKFQFSHVEWLGCAFWDLIQPSFMFMVGVSMAFSYAKRKRRGHTYFRMFSHAVWRSLVMIALGVFLISNGRDSTNWSLVNVLTQIGLGYTFLFLVWGCRGRRQFELAMVVLVVTWCMYYFYPDAGVDLKEGKPEVGVTAEWADQYLANADRGMTYTTLGENLGWGEKPVAKPWHKNANVGQRIDLDLLNRLPRREPYEFNSGGYQTINFLPSLATMIFGLMCGELLRSGRSKFGKLIALILWGGLGIAVGTALDLSGICPSVKRIWTPSWALFSTGWCCWMLAFFYLFVDLLRLGFLAFPLKVVGMNSIAIYCMGQLLRPWVSRALQTHLGDQVFLLRARWGNDYYRFFFVTDAHEEVLALYEPTIQAVMIGLVFWLTCFWMYRQKIFIRV